MVVGAAARLSLTAICEMERTRGFCVARLCAGTVAREAFKMLLKADMVAHSRARAAGWAVMGVDTVVVAVLEDILARVAGVVLTLARPPRRVRVAVVLVATRTFPPSARRGAAAVWVCTVLAATVCLLLAWYLVVVAARSAVTAAAGVRV